MSDDFLQLSGNHSRPLSYPGSSSAQPCSDHPSKAWILMTIAWGRSTLWVLGLDLLNELKFVQWRGWWCWDDQRWESCIHRGSRRLHSPAVPRSNRSNPHHWSRRTTAVAGKCRGCLFCDDLGVRRVLALSDLRLWSNAACTDHRRYRWREAAALEPSSRDYRLCFFLVLYVDVMARW